MAGLHFDITGDNKNLLRNLEGSKQGIKSLTQTAETESASLDSIMSRIGQSAAKIGIGFSATKLVSDVVRVRGEIEQLQKSFDVLAGAKGGELFEQIREFAVSTPMDMPELAKGAQTLMAFNTEAEEVMPILRAIGDISMGNKEKFQSLTLAFSQMSSSGKLMGQDLMQMINAGFNPLSVISEQTGKSIGELKEEMSKGAISADMIKKAFMDATSEGGKFNGMLESMSSSVTGQISNLKGAFEDMLNEIGQESQGMITGAISAASSLVENYEKVLDIIGQILVAYGSYKAVLAATTAFEGAATSAKYSVEIAELQAILPLKQQSANADIEQAVASGQMTEAEAEKVIALRAEVQAYVDKMNAAKAAAAHDAAEALRKKRENLEEIDSVTKQIGILREKGEHKKADALQTKLQTLEIKKATLATEAETAVEIANKAAKDADTVSTQANTVAQNTNTNSTNLLTAAKTKLAAISKSALATLTNPYVLAAAAVAALSVGIYKLVTAKSAEEKAIEKVNKKREEESKKREEERNEIDSLLNTINDDTQTRTAQVKAYDKLTKKMPELTKELSLEAFQAMSAAEQQKKLNEIIEQADYNKAKSSLGEYNRMLEELKNTPWGEMSQETKDYLEKSGINGTNFRKEGIQLLTKEIENLKKEVDAFDEANTTIDVKIEAAENIQKQAQDAYEKALKAYEDAKAKYQDRFGQSVENWDDILPSWVVARLREAEELLANANKNVDSLKGNNGGAKSTTKDKTFWENQKKTAQTEIDKLDVSQIGGAIWQKYQAQIEEADRMLEKFSGKYIENAKKRDQELVELKAKTYHEMGEIAGSELAKELDDIKANYDARIKELGKLEKEWRKAQGGSLTSEQQESLTTAREAAKMTHDKAANDARLEYQRDIDDAMLDLKRQTQDDWMSLEENEHAAKMVAIQRDYEDRIAEIDRQERELKEKQGGTLTEDQQKAFVDARGAAQSKKEYDEAQANKDALNTMLADIITYNQKRQQVEEEYAKERKKLFNEDGSKKEGVTDANVANFDKNKEKALQAVDEEFASKSAEFQGWMDMIADMTLKQLTKELETAEAALANLEGQEEVDEQELAKARAKVTTLNKQIEKVEGKEQVKGRSIEKWKELKDVLSETGDEFSALGDEIGGTAGDILKNVGTIVSTSMSMMNNIVQVVEMCSTGMVGTATAGAAAMSTIEKASVILAVISAAIQLITKIVNLANKAHDAKYEKTIARNQEKIDNLKSSYEDLQETVDETFGSTAVQGLQEMNANLERQNKLIAEQKAAEEDKKKTDEEALKSYDEQMEENRKQMEENTRAMEEAIFGEDIKSAIENFAEAYGEAIAEGKNLNQSMKEHAVSMMKQMVQEQIKEYIQGQGRLEALRKKMELYFEDDVFSDAEIEAIKAEAAAIGKDLDQKFAWAEELLAEDTDGSSSSSKRGIATASQESVDENNGRLMSIQLSMGEITAQMALSVQTMNLISKGVSDGNIVLSDIRLQAVKANGFLEDIVKYTKPLNDSIVEVVNAVKKIQL